MEIFNFNITWFSKTGLKPNYIPYRAVLRSYPSVTIIIFCYGSPSYEDEWKDDVAEICFTLQI